MNFNPKLILPSEYPFLKKETAHEYLNVLNVAPEYENFVRIFDENDDLVLIHYLSQSVDPGFNNEIMRHVGHVRGVIIEKNTKKIICKSWGYTQEELVEKYYPEMENWHDLSTLTFVESREGTILRLYYYKNQWNISTHRKLYSNNFTNKFLAFEIIDEFGQDKIGILDTQKVNVFLMSNPQNTLVYPVDKPSLLYVTTWNPNNNKFEYNYPFVGMFKKIEKSDHSLTLERLCDESKIYTKDTLNDLFSKEFNKFNCAAVLCIDNLNSENPQVVKFVTREYYNLKELRGIAPNLKYRYLELLDDFELLEQLKETFTDSASLLQFSSAQKDFDLLAKKIHSMYLEKYIHKVNRQLPKEEFVTVQRCHAWYLQNNRNKVTLDIVKKFLKTTASYYLIKMIKRVNQKA